jgi:DNA repair protein RecN (Recombination protein N)
VLSQIHVRDLALIEDVWLEFGPGMTVLTGETGAGKTALVGALKLLLGERADSGAVRHGASETLVEGSFDLAERELLVKRRVTADGRSKCTLDGEMATVGQLADKIGPLVDLHGQHEHQALLSPATHVGYLDRWAGPAVGVAVAEYRQALAAYREAAGESERVAAALSDAATRADYLRFVADEIAKVDPRSNEDEELRAALPPLQHAEKLAEAANEAVVGIRSDGGASDAIAGALAALEKVQGVDPALDSLAERAYEAAALLEDASAQLRTYRDRIEFDPAALDAVLGRLSELSALCKKHGPTLDDVIRTRQDAEATLSALELGEEAVARAQAAQSAAEAALRDAATAVNRARAEAVPGFVAALAEAAADLALDGARFDVEFSELPFEQWNDSGPAKTEFLYAPAPAVPPRPLARIASGGEVSRVMLALKGVLGTADDVPTLVFDEVDAGVGGAVAQAVGRRLAQLSRSRQVIVVTHLAQVAACADRQIVVTKSVDESGAVTQVVAVEGEQRVAEIARMLSGNDSAASLEHARELLGTCGTLR